MGNKGNNLVKKAGISAFFRFPIAVSGNFAGNAEKQLFRFLGCSGNKTRNSLSAELCHHFLYTSGRKRWRVADIPQDSCLMPFPSAKFPLRAYTHFACAFLHVYTITITLYRKERHIGTNAPNAFVPQAFWVMPFCMPSVLMAHRGMSLCFLTRAVVYAYFRIEAVVCRKK